MLRLYRLGFSTCSGFKTAHNNIIKERKDWLEKKKVKEKECTRLLRYFVCACTSEWMNLRRFLVAQR
jgi:hypothetical protein